MMFFFFSLFFTLYNLLKYSLTNAEAPANPWIVGKSSLGSWSKPTEVGQGCGIVNVDFKTFIPTGIAGAIAFVTSLYSLF